MNKTRIIVCGALGKMGSRIIRLAQADSELEVAGGVEAKDNTLYTKDISSVLPSGDVVIDFTAPAATLEHLALCKKARKAIVIGTTGFSVEEIKNIKEASVHVPVVFSPNMSVGVNLLFILAKETAKALSNYDIEIVELHHNQKKDAPSGTAAKLSEIIADSLGRKIEDVGIYGRKGVTGARTKEEIGVMAVRAGDIVGEHTVYFAGPGERIELTHRAHSRDTFAAGAIVAAKWVVRQKPGLYDMQHVLKGVIPA